LWTGTTTKDRDGMRVLPILEAVDRLEAGFNDRLRARIDAFLSWPRKYRSRPAENGDAPVRRISNTCSSAIAEWPARALRVTESVFQNGLVWGA
jgi:hypothetical protein